MDHQKLNILLIFGTFSFGGCGGQGCYFWPNPRVISKNSAIQDYQNTFKPKLAWIFLPARAKWSIQVCIETPCNDTSILWFSSSWKPCNPPSHNRWTKQSLTRRANLMSSELFVAGRSDGLRLAKATVEGESRVSEANFKTTTTVCSSSSLDSSTVFCRLFVWFFFYCFETTNCS